MFTDIYAIKDELAEMWSNVFCLNNKTAQRTFQFMAKEKTEADCKDQKIYLLGRFNKDEGTISLLKEPAMVYDLEKSWKEFNNA